MIALVHVLGSGGYLACKPCVLQIIDVVVVVQVEDSVSSRYGYSDSKFSPLAGTCVHSVAYGFACTHNILSKMSKQFLRCEINSTVWKLNKGTRDGYQKANMFICY